MIRGFLLAIGVLRAVFLSRADLLLENLALRQQLAMFARNGRRPRIVAADRLFWLALRRLWLRWSDVLVFVKPETVVRWHQASFRRYWTWLSQRRRRGRPPIDPRLRALIHRLALENPTWGAPRIHGELLMLGFEVSERSVSRCLPRRRPPPGALERWLTFLRNHRASIAAMDFFTVPTATFRVLYVWFAIEHARRRILHFDVTEHPLASWVVQQLREAFPYDTAPHHLVFDRDAIFSARVVSIVDADGAGRCSILGVPGGGPDSRPAHERRRFRRCRSVARSNSPSRARVSRESGTQPRFGGFASPTCRHRELKHRAARHVRRRPQPSSVCLDDRT